MNIPMFNPPDHRLLPDLDLPWPFEFPKEGQPSHERTQEITISSSSSKKPQRSGTFCFFHADHNHGVQVDLGDVAGSRTGTPPFIRWLFHGSEVFVLTFAIHESRCAGGVLASTPPVLRGSSRNSISTISGNFGCWRFTMAVGVIASRKFLIIWAEICPDEIPWYHAGFPWRLGYVFGWFHFIIPPHFFSGSVAPCC